MRNANVIKAINDVTTEQVAVGAASAQSSALTQGVYDICADTACYIKIAAAPTAAAGTSYYLPADVIVRFFIEDQYKVANIQHTAGGFINITQVNNA